MQPLLEQARSAEAIGAAAVQIAGISLPLFYSVLTGTLRQAYREAPESVRDYAMKRPFVKFFEIPAWTLGIWGLVLVVVSHAGHQPGIFTRAAVVALSVFVIVAIAISFWRTVAAGSPWTLVPDMSSDIQQTIKDAKEEFRAKSDPEVLKALRDILAGQIRMLLELAQFTAAAPIRSQWSAKVLAVAAHDIANEYRDIQGRIPPNSEWHQPTPKHPSLFLVGGIPSPAATARVAPTPQLTRREAWVEAELALVMQSALRIAVKEHAEESTAILHEIFSQIMRDTARAGLVEASLGYHDALMATLSELHQGDARAVLVLEDRLGALFSTVIDGLAESRPNAEVTARVLHDLSKDLTLLPSAGGPAVRTLTPRIRNELLAEQRIESSILTPLSATTERIAQAANRDLAAPSTVVLKAISAFTSARAKARPAKSKTLGIASIIQAYHSLARMQRRLGSQLPPLHELDRPTFHISDKELFDAHAEARRDIITSALRVLSDIEDLRHDPKDPDMAGMLYYYTGMEGVDALIQADWPDAPKWVAGFLHVSWYLSSLMIPETKQKIAPQQAYASLCALREGLRVAGYGVLWASVRGEASSRRMRGDLRRWLTEAARGSGRTPEDLIKGWCNLVEKEMSWNFGYQDSRFGQDNDVWDALVRLGIAQPLMVTGYEPTAAARERGDYLVAAVSRDPGDLLHEMDAVFLAVAAEWFGIDADSLPDRVRETYRDLHRPYGKYGRPFHFQHEVQPEDTPPEGTPNREDDGQRDSSEEGGEERA